jgi:N-methylhydantoinase A
VIASAAKRDLIIATDVGGTCTDTVVFVPGAPVVLGKRLSTPPDYAHGVLDSIGSAADAMGLTLAELFARTRLFIHGSTVVDNTVFERVGARTGLVTTEGFEDTLLVTRGAYGRWAGLSEDKLKHPVHTERAPALVAADCIAGVPERVDYKGEIILPSTKWRPSARCGILSKPAKWKRSPFRSCGRSTRPSTNGR